MSISMSLHGHGNGVPGCGKRWRVATRPFIPARKAAKRSLAVKCQSTAQDLSSTRRRAVQYATTGLAAAFLPGLVPSAACAAKCLNIRCAAPGGYTPIKDTQDGYSFLSPFGWQEVAVKGQDIVYKDIIEPLESVSVSMTPTDKATIDDFGSPVEIAATLSKNVLTPQNQDVKVLNAGEREADGRKYIEFEFASKASTYIRHALASVTVANGKFYTLTTGANEFRWDKMKDRLKTVVQSFEVVERF